MKPLLTPRETLTLLGFTPEQIDAMLKTAGLWEPPYHHLTIDMITRESLRVLESQLAIVKGTNVE